MPTPERLAELLRELDAEIADGDAVEEALAAESRRWTDDVITDVKASSPPKSLARPLDRRERPDDLIDLVEPPGYYRDRAGRWRYREGGALVPGARDVTLANAWRFPIRSGFVLVPVRLARERVSPELAWCAYIGAEEVAAPAARRAVERPDRRQQAARAWAVPTEEWRWRSGWPIGLAAPELAVDRLVDAAGVAALFGIGPGSIRVYVARGTLPPPVRRIGRVALWSMPVLLFHRSTAPTPGKVAVR